MRIIIVSIFLVLSFLCSPAMSMTAENWFNNAKALWDEGEGKFTKPQKAIKYLSNAIKLQPNYASAYNSRGNAYADLGKYQHAIKDYNQALSLKPDYVYAYINRGDAYYDLGQYERAVEDCNQAIGLKKDNAVAYSNRGKAYAKLGQYQRAIDDFNEAIRLRPDDINAYNNRGIAYLLQGNKNLGCHDAQKTCAKGLCKVLEWAKRKGYCLQEQSVKTQEDKVGIPASDFSVTGGPEKQSQPAIEKAGTLIDAKQHYKGIKGIVLLNGYKIEGQIINMNNETIEIRTKDGNVSSYSFIKEVRSFIPE